MIPVIPKQRQHKPSASKRFNALIDYLQGDKEQAKAAQQEAGIEASSGGRATQSSDFSDVLNYATAPVDTKIQGEKCIAVRTHGVSSIETASLEMNAVSRKNMRCEDPVYHFILSWPEHERPETPAIFDAAEHAIRSLGFEEHQYVIAVHANTDNIHCHVAMNRVHPATFKSRHIEWAKRTLHFAARESEIKHGWSHDNGIYVVEVNAKGEKQIVLNTKRAHEVEEGAQIHPEIEREDAAPTWHDADGLTAWLRGPVAKELREDLNALTGWQGLHLWLDRHGIEIHDTGGGGMRLRATSPDTGEILDVPASKGLRLLKRADLEKRWGAFEPVFTVPVISPPQSHLTPAQLEKGVSHVIGIGNDIAREFDLDRYGVPPPDHFDGPDAGRAPRPEAVPDGSGELHDVPGSDLAADGQLHRVLLPGAVQGDLGDREAGQDPRVRPDAAGHRQGGRRGDEQLGGAQLSATGRKPRDPALRAERKAERAARREDLRRRYATYRNFVKAGDTDHFARMKELRAERGALIKVVNADVKAARAALGKDMPADVRLLALVEIDAEASRRKLQAHAQYEQRADALRVTRVPPLAWREWLYEQSNRGDKAALSALRGIVYQAKRDAKQADDELEDLDPAAQDYVEQQHKRLLRRLLEEERKEAAIRSTSVHAMRPHEVDALVLLYAGMVWRVTGNGNVEYSSAAGDHLFTDRGNRVTFDRVRVSDDEIKLALAHSREKFGQQITLTGEDAVFTARMARLATDMGFVVLNPEMQGLVQEHRASSREARAGLAVQPVVVDVPEAGRLVPQPTEPANSREQLKADVLGIDPRARFIEVDNQDASRVYVGPVAASREGPEPAFAQHLGRGAYALHRMPAPAAPDAGDVEIRYRAGQPVATVNDRPAGLER